MGADPAGAGAREVTVVPVDDEFGLRNLDWIESNRRKVDQMTGGRVAYVHLPDTANGGYTNFNRYFFAQVGKEAAILDERYQPWRRSGRLHHRPSAAAADEPDHARAKGTTSPAPAAPSTGPR